jgi:hypothetical protein
LGQRSPPRHVNSHDAQARLHITFGELCDGIHDVCVGTTLDGSAAGLGPDGNKFLLLAWRAPRAVDRYAGPQRVQNSRPWPHNGLARRGPDMFVDVFREHVERHVATKYHGIVERLHIEPRSERRPRLFALPIDLAVTHLIAACLSWP